jgi:hypothetical protein
MRSSGANFVLVADEIELFAIAVLELIITDEPQA